MKMRQKILLISMAVVLFTCIFTGCAGKKQDKEGISIVCTVYPAYDFIMNIVGDTGGVNVTYLLKKGVDMHNFQPTAEDIITITDSDLMVYVGGESDRSIKDILATADINKVSLLSLVEAKKEELLPGMESGHANEGEEHEAEYDEHVWLSVKNALLIVDKLCEAVCEADSVNADNYRANAALYKEKLAALDKKYGDMVNGAARNIVLVADRFPFAYLADDYKLACYAAFPGCSAETEAGFETIVFLAETLKNNNLPVIFILENSDGALAATVASSAGVTVSIKVLDSMQSVSETQIKNGYSYISTMENNLSALTEALN